MPNTQSNLKTSDLKAPDPGDMISDVYYSLDDALEVAKEFPELEKGVLKILKEDYNITE
jgi:hypothetical protein